MKGYPQKLQNDFGCETVETQRKLLESMRSGLGRSPGEGNGYPPQYSRLKNSMDRGAWRATAHGVTKNQTQLRDFHSLMR